MNTEHVVALDYGQGGRQREALIVVLDPGHGGRDPGAVGPSGLLEKDVCLNICLETRRLLQAQGIDVRLTRETDVNVPLNRRVAPAGARALISVHCNAFTNREANGTETFWRPGGHSEGQRLAQLVQNALLRALGRRNRGVKNADFQVLRQARVPAVLAELAFISNLLEESILRDPAIQQRTAAAIADAIIAFLQ